MSPVAIELDETLAHLEPQLKERLERNVRLLLLDVRRPLDLGPVDERGWPFGYFEKFAGSFTAEALERPDQGVLTPREEW